MAVTLRATGDPRHPYRCVVDGELWLVRLNEFPEEPSLYSLLVDGVVREELMQWPIAWSRPDEGASGGDALERAEYERELAKGERTRAIGPSKTVK